MEIIEISKIIADEGRTIQTISTREGIIKKSMISVLIADGTV